MKTNEEDERTMTAAIIISGMIIGIITVIIISICAL